MRITRNYRNGLMSARKANENTSLFRKALSRNNSSRNSGRAAAILNSINKTSGPGKPYFSTDTKTEKFYYDMKYHAGQVEEYAEALTDGEKNSIYDKAKESGSTEEIQAKITGFVNQYNKMIDDLSESGSKSDSLLKMQMDSTVRIYAAQLASTGVTKRSDGTLVLDEKKLAAADLETLQKVWGGKDSFANQAARKADAVKASAQQNMKAQASSNYTNPFDRANLYANYGSKGNYFNFFR